jgi:hypothetical protein
MCGGSVEVASDVVAVRGVFPDIEQEAMPVCSVSGRLTNCQGAEQSVSQIILTTLSFSN